MILYVIIAFTAILIGMAISVYAFGTGGKRKKIFQDIYFSIEDVDGIGVLYTKTGEYSATIKIENPVQKYQPILTVTMSSLICCFKHRHWRRLCHPQAGCVCQKQSRMRPDNHEFFSESYFRYFVAALYRQSDLSDYHSGEQKEPSFSFDSKKYEIPCKDSQLKTS